VPTGSVMFAGALSLAPAGLASRGREVVKLTSLVFDPLKPLGSHRAHGTAKVDWAARDSHGSDGGQGPATRDALLNLLEQALDAWQGLRERNGPAFLALGASQPVEQ
jgi:hypothetical protein